jgi:hypothetical protein
LRKLLYRFELRLALLAVVGMLFAQSGALSHAYSHDVRAAGPPTHQPAVGGHDPCSDCLGYAALLSPGATPCALAFTVPQGGSSAPCALPDSLVQPAATLAFRSRAPPDTLS